MKRKKSKPDGVEPNYQPTTREKSAIGKYPSRMAAQTAPRMKVLKGDEAMISPDHPDQTVAWALFSEAFGTADADFVNGLIEQLANVGSQSGQIDEGKLNFMFSIIKGIKPTDQLEAMLAAQMAAVHMAIMTFARRLATVETIEEQDSAERTFNKLTRTFTTQMEALKRYRTGGEQKVTVQHVSVGEGGKAFVGNLTRPTPEPVPERPANETSALTDARQRPMTVNDNEERATFASQRKRKDAKRSSA
jgi:hypothetical protein